MAVAYQKAILFTSTMPNPKVSGIDATGYARQNKIVIAIEKSGNQNIGGRDIDVDIGIAASSFQFLYRRYDKGDRTAGYRANASRTGTRRTEFTHGCCCHTLGVPSEQWLPDVMFNLPEHSRRCRLDQGKLLGREGKLTSLEDVMYQSKMLQLQTG